MNHQISNISWVRATLIVNNGKNHVTMVKIILINFYKLCMNGYLTSSLRMKYYRMKDDYFALLEFISKVYHLINNNVGFIIVVWFKCSNMNDKELMEYKSKQMNNHKYIYNNVIQVKNGDTSYHINELYPTNQDLGTHVLILVLNWSK